MPPKATKAVVPVTPTGGFDDMTYNELIALIDSGQVAHIQEIDDLVRAQKEALVGVAFVITEWSLNPDGDLGEFVTVKVVTEKGEHRFFSDGSTGIKDQLKAAEAKMGGRKPILVPKGLRVSNYMYHDENLGKDIPAATYYIDNSDA